MDQTSTFESQFKWDKDKKDGKFALTMCGAMETYFRTWIMHQVSPFYNSKGMIDHPQPVWDIGQKECQCMLSGLVIDLANSVYSH